MDFPTPWKLLPSPNEVVADPRCVQSIIATFGILGLVLNASVSSSQLTCSSNELYVQAKTAVSGLYKYIRYLLQ